MKHRRRLPLASSLPFVLALAALPAYGQGSTSVLVSGLQSPIKLIMTPAGNLLVSEAGLPASFVPNQGRVSFVDRSGTRRTLIGGLPAGIDLEGGALGPTALLLDGPRTLYVAIGQGDVITRPVPFVPGVEVPNPEGPVSALFGSLLRVHFSRSIDRLDGEFLLDPAMHHPTLVDGFPVELTNPQGERATVEVVADFRDIYPRNKVSTSNPFGLAMVGDDLFLPDSGQNSLVRLRRGSGLPQTIVHFPALANTLPFGPPFVDAVPDSVRPFGRSRLLVTLLSGFPFGPGASRIFLVDTRHGTAEPFVTGRTTAIDTLPLGHAWRSFLVLEFSSDLLGGGLGSLLRFDSPLAVPDTIEDQLVTPTSMVMDPATNEVFITEIATGRIVVVQL